MQKEGVSTVTTLRLYIPACCYATTVPLTAAQIRSLEAGRNINVRPDQIGRGSVDVDMDDEQMEKVHKCARSRSGRGVRIGGGRPKQVTGSSFGGSLSRELDSYRKKQQGGKFKIKAPSAKQLKKTAQAGKMVADTGAQLYGYDSALDAGVSQAQQAAYDRGYDNKATRAVSKLAKKQGDKLIDQQLGGAIKWGKVGKVAMKVGKVANHISKAATGDSLSDMAISYGLENSIGRLDPTGGVATSMITNQVQKAANKEIDKRGGSFVKQGQGVGVSGSSKAMPLVRSKYQNTLENPNRWVSVRRMQL
jgi:hypothetical protein